MGRITNFHFARIISPNPCFDNKGHQFKWSWIVFNLTCIFSFPFFYWQILAVLLFPWQYAKGQGSDASQFGSLENVPLTDKWWYIKTRIIEILEAQLCTSKFHCIAASSLVCLLGIIMVRDSAKNLSNNITRKHWTCTLRITSKFYFFTKNIQKQFFNQTVLLSRPWMF